MAIIASESGTPFKPVPLGAHIGRCFRVIDLGTQKTTWKGKEKETRKIMIAWELTGEDENGATLFDEEGHPLAIAKRYTLSLGENANLRHDLESWRGKSFNEDELKGFDISKLLGVYGMVNVTHDARDGKTYANVSSLSPLPAALRANKPAPVNPVQLFDVSEPDMAVFEKLSDKLKETIQACAEWRNISKTAAASANAMAEEDIEF